MCTVRGIVHYLLLYFIISSLDVTQYFSTFQCSPSNCRRQSTSLLVNGVWTTFDLVRPWHHAWGSNATTPFFRFYRPDDGRSDGYGAKFGFSIANLGDLDFNGVDDIAVGAPGETNPLTNETNVGGVYIFLMNDNGTYINYTHINGLGLKQPVLQAGDEFGYSLACLGQYGTFFGITLLAVGAPGTYVSSVYVLFINRLGEVLDYTLIRGKYVDQVANVTNTNTSSNHAPSFAPTVSPAAVPAHFNTSYIINGPPIFFGSRFGSAVANLGPWDANYFCVLAVSLISTSGQTGVYLLYLNGTGFVHHYVLLTPQMAGIHNAYGNFGSSVTILPRIHHLDPFFTVAIGASTLYQPGSINTAAGTVFLFYVKADGTVNHTRIVEEAFSESARFPFVVSETSSFFFSQKLIVTEIILSLLFSSFSFF